MVGLKLISYIILLTAVLISRPGTELCIYNGAIEIAEHTLNSNHNHCSENDHNTYEKNHKHSENPKDQLEQNCCIDFKISETLGNIAPINNFLDLKLICLPILIQNYFIELQNQFAPNNRELLANNKLFCRIINFDHLIPNNTSFHFTSTVLLLI